MSEEETAPELTADQIATLGRLSREALEFAYLRLRLAAGENLSVLHLTGLVTTLLAQLRVSGYYDKEGFDQMIIQIIEKLSEGTPNE